MTAGVFFFVFFFLHYWGLNSGHLVPPKGEKKLKHWRSSQLEDTEQAVEPLLYMAGMLE
jgi:hypothetical protein